MTEEVLEVLTGIGTSIVNIVTFLFSTIKSLLSLTLRLPSMLEFIVNSFALMPSILQTFALVTMSALILLFIVGRNVGGSNGGAK